MSFYLFCSSNVSNNHRSTSIQFVAEGSSDSKSHWICTQSHRMSNKSLKSNADVHWFHVIWYKNPYFKVITEAIEEHSLRICSLFVPGILQFICECFLIKVCFALVCCVTLVYCKRHTFSHTLMNLSRWPIESTARGLIQKVK